MDKYSFSNGGKSDHMLRNTEKHHNYLEKNTIICRLDKKKTPLFTQSKL